ncbi:Zinc finger, B-box [Corchorus olitorius]|uniref:Zinc finger, B-box n=1 Tax=Corchorus olitorius TaxID=93759 RepID=A0A1R3GNP1_9ROSI|nr:Zinc finger, B-box [Corchorus olitorius]
MGFDIASVKAGWSMGLAAKTCDSCKSAAAAIFCRTDSAFMCLNCDSRIHSAGNNKLVSSRHERVWMCEVCEQAPAAVTCKADAAALCVTCDADIHSANPLARRHERVPVEPFFDSADNIVKSSPFSFLVPSTTDQSGTCQPEEVEPGSWLLPSNPNINSKLALETSNHVKTGDLFFSEMDPFMDFDYQNSFQQPHHNAAMDSVVPVQTKPTPIPVINNNENCFDIDFCRSKLPTFSYQTQSISHSVSSSSLEVGVVPDGNSLSDISYPFGRTMTDPNAPISATTTANNQAPQAGGIDREARVLRYREKRKNRKFEKTIRYASRKAYAESRPRIKGRFAKRTELDNEVDHLFNLPTSAAAAAYMSDAQYGVVPSF